MSGRRAPRQFLHDDPRSFPHGFRELPPPPLGRESGPLPHPMALHEELEIQREEIARLLSDNRHLAEDHLLLRRDFIAVKEELHHVSQIIPKIRAEKELQVRDLIEKGLKLEADLRAAEPLKAEVMKLRAEAKQLDAIKQDLTAKVKELTKNLAKAQSENQQLPAMRAEMDSLHQEIVRARTAFEYEKNANMEQMEQRQAMEKNLVSMAREIEKLRAELSTKESKPWMPGAGNYSLTKGTQELGYAEQLGDGFGSEKSHYYGSGSWGAYEKFGRR